ncbi:MAG: hypothetical protein UH241_06035, partial [Acutalibacteraceae bacterium]|nr:hypothetical protein [Acutalibacteraceae bacterium]
VLGVSDKVASINVNYGEGADKVTLVPEYAYSTMLASNIKDDDIIITAKCQDVIDAPVAKGTVLGTATVTYNGEELTKVNLIAEKTVEKSDWLYFLAVAKNVVTSTIFLVIVGVIALLFVTYATIVIVRSVKNKKKAK